MQGVMLRIEREDARTDSGSGTQPRARPNRTTGGATGEVCITSTGGPTSSGAA